jgi:hypothetical protein
MTMAISIGCANQNGLKIIIIIIIRSKSGLQKAFYQKARQ